jgi:nucleosome binding factor SPN SPT16 subunit
MMQYYFTTEMSTYIDEEKPVTNEKLSELTENALEDPKMAKRIRIPPEVFTIFDHTMGPLLKHPIL